MTVLEIPYIIKPEIIQTIGTNNIERTDHETIQTKDQTITIITIDRVTLPRIEIKIIKIDSETFLNHLTEIIHISKFTTKP